MDIVSGLSFGGIGRCGVFFGRNYGVGGMERKVFDLSLKFLERNF